MARCNGGILSAGMPAIERASACAPRPAAFTTCAAAMRMGAAPPVSMMSPRSAARPARTGVSNAIIAPWASASPRSASMKAWLSTMPVEGDNSARSATSAGSSARASSAAEPDEIGDAVGLGLGFERGELVDLARVHRHQELAASLVGNAELLAERVQHRFAVDAEPRLVEPRRIVDAGVDDFAVARTDPRADPAFAFDDDHLPPGAGERPRDGEADDARADDQTLDQFHPSTLCSKWSVLRGAFFAADASTGQGASSQMIRVKKPRSWPRQGRRPAWR